MPSGDDVISSVNLFVSSVSDESYLPPGDFRPADGGVRRAPRAPPGVPRDGVDAPPARERLGVGAPPVPPRFRRDFPCDDAPIDFPLLSAAAAAAAARASIAAMTRWRARAPWAAPSAPGKLGCRYHQSYG